MKVGRLVDHGFVWGEFQSEEAAMVVENFELDLMWYQEPAEVLGAGGDVVTQVPVWISMPAAEFWMYWSLFKIVAAVL